MKPAFILGNGPSRQVLNLDELKTKGIIWGCNALYRDFAPHYLLVIDKKMQQEVINAKYYENNYVIFKQISDKSHIPAHRNIYTFNQRVCSPNNSGVASVYFALRRGHRNIYLIGFDHEDPNKGQQSNVYAGTSCYDRHGTRPPKLPKNILDKLGFWALKNHEKVKFTRVINPETCRIPEEQEGYKEPYMKHITYEEFSVCNW